MRRFYIILLFLICCALRLFAQIIENPVFDRTDVYKFRVIKVESKDDTTFVYCSYSAEEHSWANISDKTYIEDVRNGKRYPIVKVSGIPFSPDKRHFTDEEEIEVVLYFPHVSTDKINIIENEEEAFNIYGIDLKHAYDLSYTPEDIHLYFKSYDKFDKEENWHAALEVAQKQLDATNYVEGIRSFASACSMYNIIMSYCNLKEYDKVIEWGKRAIDILCELPQDSIYLDVLARTYGNVGVAYTVLKQYEIASHYTDMSLEIRRMKDGIGALNYEEYLRHMSVLYYNEGNYPKALLYGKEVAYIYEKKYAENSEKYGCVYIQSLNNLCEYYRMMRKYDEAVDVGRKSMALINRGEGKECPELKYAAYNNLAGALVNNGQTGDGIVLLEKVLFAASKNSIDDEGLLNSSRLQLASIYLYHEKDTLKALHEYEYVLKAIENAMNFGEYDSDTYSGILEKLYEINRWTNPVVAMQYLNKAINTQCKRYGDESVVYANLLLEKIRNMWVPSLSDNKDLDSLLFYLLRASEIIKRHLRNSSCTMSKNEFTSYWHRYEPYFTWLIPTISGILRTKESNSIAYDAVLYYKGMLLASENQIKDIIDGSKDNSLRYLYNEYTKRLSLLEKQYSNHPSPSVIDSLKSIILEEEFQLSQKVTRLYRYDATKNVSWKDVKRHLNEKDVAIEIVSYTGIKDKDVLYDAYVITPNSDSPQLIPLCVESVLKTIMCSDSIDYEGLSILFWGNEEIFNAIKDAENIYISPSGLFNSIGFEYLPIAGGRFINDRFNIYRLSSTRELCYSKLPIKTKNVCLYGGLDYNGVKADSVNNSTKVGRVSRSMTDYITKRGGFEPLDGSKQEVYEIIKELARNNINCQIYTELEGSEESFKKLSDKEINIIHLSTHGMFVSTDTTLTNQNKNLHFIITGEESNADEEVQALSRSVLIMSGGNMLAFRDSIPQETDDGVLTALEISHLDFKDLDLVVLSACETALGDVNNEGVYGLQRGFKKAGANTILMSLDKVDDEATRILMVEFYRNLMNGKTKRQSLQKAQQYLRKVYNGKYDEPKYWASFIMLDGLN